MKRCSLNSEFRLRMFTQNIKNRTNKRVKSIAQKCIILFFHILKSRSAGVDLSSTKVNKRIGWNVAHLTIQRFEVMLEAKQSASSCYILKVNLKYDWYLVSKLWKILFMLRRQRKRKPDSRWITNRTSFWYLTQAMLIFPSIRSYVADQRNT